MDLSRQPLSLQGCFISLCMDECVVSMSRPVYNHLLYVLAHMKSIISDSWESTLKNGLKHPCSYLFYISQGVQTIQMPYVSVSPMHHTYKEQTIYL